MQDAPDRSIAKGVAVFLSVTPLPRHAIPILYYAIPATYYQERIDRYALCLVRMRYSDTRPDDLPSIPSIRVILLYLFSMPMRSALPKSIQKSNLDSFANALIYY